jgi:hypothetical protein
LLEGTLTGLILQDPATGPEPAEFSQERRANGEDWPLRAHSMIGIARLKNLRLLVKEILDNGIPGDFIETGVWRGGTCIYLRALLAVRDVTDRTVWVADSFEGLPAPDKNYPPDGESTLHTYKELAVPLEEVKANFAKYGLLDSRVQFLKGWFKDTLPTAPIEQLALLRLDGDLYESTIQSLDSLYDRVSVGGFIVVDDYGAIEGCRRAVEDFRAEHGITTPLQQIDWTSWYWRKGTW